MANPKFEMDVIEYARKFAIRLFAGEANEDDRVADTIRLAWQFARTAGPTATVGSCVRYAVTRAKSVRMLGMSVRSIDHPRNSNEVSREHLDVSDLFSGIYRERDDPAVIVQVRLDFADWLESLSPLQVTVVRLLVNGERPSDVAKAAGVSAGRVSQLRRELLANWNEFTE